MKTVFFLILLKQRILYTYFIYILFKNILFYKIIGFI